MTAAWAFSIGSTALLSIEGGSLPPQLQDYVTSAGGAVYDPPVAFLYYVLFAAHVAASVGILLFKRWARKLYVLTFAASVLLLPTLPPAVLTPWASLFSALAWLAISSLIVLMHLPPVRDYFGGRKSDFS